MQVQLFKKMSNYKDKDGNEKTATNFMIKCGDYYIPIEVKFFADAERGGVDPNFRARKMTLSAFADILPEKQSKPSQFQSPVCPQCHKPMFLSHKDTMNGITTRWWECHDCDVCIVEDSTGHTDVCGNFHPKCLEN